MKSTSLIRAKGIFVISLDLELYWGVRDVLSFPSYREHILGERKVVPILIKLFEEYDIHCTWAIVGFLFFDDHKTLIKGLPDEMPSYSDPTLSPYHYVDSIGSNEQNDPFHYGLSLINIIKQHKTQEIGTHTFSHYYCLEDGQTPAQFVADLSAAVKTAAKHGVRVESLVFPRNQVNSRYLVACAASGIKAYRGTQQHWLYRPRRWSDESIVRRAIRLADSYINISGDHIYELPISSENTITSVPQSMFLYPYSRKRRFIERLRIKRIQHSLTRAAQQGKIYHLWWHPHNFGVDTQYNIEKLKCILEHYRKVKREYGMESLGMAEVARRAAASTLE